MQLWQKWLVQVAFDRRKNTEIVGWQTSGLGEWMTTELNRMCLDSWIVSHLGQHLLTTLAPASHQTTTSCFAKPVPGPASNLHWGSDSCGWRPSLHQVIDLQPGATGVLQEAASRPITISAVTRLGKWISLLVSERAKPCHLAAVLLLCSPLRKGNEVVRSKGFPAPNNSSSLFKVTFWNILVFP